MKKLAFIFCLLFSQMAFANGPESVKPTVQEHMKALSWLTGEWQGKGWISLGPNQKYDFKQTEKIQYKLDNTLLHIEGLGKNGQEVRHNALALMTYDATKGQYAFHSYTAEGRHQTNADVTVADKKVIWQMNSGPNRLIRYTIWLDDKNQWQEIGETTTDNGQTWDKFFEMTLQKVK